MCYDTHTVDIDEADDSSIISTTAINGQDIVNNSTVQAYPELLIEGVEHINNYNYNINNYNYNIINFSKYICTLLIILLLIVILSIVILKLIV